MRVATLPALAPPHLLLRGSHKLVELEADEARDEGGCGCDRGDDLSGDGSACVIVLGGDLVVESPQVTAGRHKEHVVVNVLVKIDGAEPETSEARRLGETGKDGGRVLLDGCLVLGLLLGLGLVGGDLDAVLGGEVGDDDVAEDLLEDHLVGVPLDAVHFCPHVSRGDNEVVVVPHLGILADGVDVEDQGGGAPLGATPEVGARAGLLVWGEIVKELPDIIVEELLKLEPTPNDAVLEAVGALINEGLLNVQHGLKLGVLLSIQRLLEVGGAQITVDVLGGLLEISLEVVPGPLQSVLDHVGEVLEGTYWDRLLRGVPGGSVILRELGDNNLGVALRPEGSGLEHGESVEDATLVHVEPGLDVVEGCADAVELVVKGVPEDILGFAPDPLFHGCDVHCRVHDLGGLGPGGTLGGVDVGVAEKELPAQITLLDPIHVGNGNVALLPTSYAHHGPVLEHLAPDGTPSDEEVVQVKEGLLGLKPKNCNLAVVP